MAKSASPVRLQADLMQAAADTGERYHRSAAEQVEYWASLGRQIARFVDPDSLMEVAAGLARLKIEPVVVSVVDPEAVFAAVEADRRSGRLAQTVSTAAVRYQASTTHPGLLEQIDAEDNRTVGTFSSGVFTPIGEHSD